MQMEVARMRSWSRVQLRARISEATPQILDVPKLQAQLWQPSVWKERESRTGKAQPMSPKLQAVALPAIKGAAQQAAAWEC